MCHSKLSVESITPLEGGFVTLEKVKFCSRASRVKSYKGGGKQEACFQSRASVVEGSTTGCFHLHERCCQHEMHVICQGRENTYMQPAGEFTFCNVQIQRGEENIINIFAAPECAQLPFSFVNRGGFI